MRIALDVSAAPAQLAGAGRYMAEIAQRLGPPKDELTLVTRRGDGARWSHVSPHAQIGDVVPIGRVTRLAYEMYGIGRSPVARSVDVWHSPHYTMPHSGDTPIVVTIHDMTFFTHPEWHETAKVSFFRRAISYAAQHASALIAVSAYTARELETIVDAQAPVIVAPHGVDLQRFAPRDDDPMVAQVNGREVNRPYILFVGTLEPRKGIDVLLNSFAAIGAEDREIELWIAGQAGWGITDVEATLETHPYRDRIHRLGFVDDALLPSLLRHAQVVAYPSRGEGFGLPVLEAMACGALVVTSSDTVMEEVAGNVAWLASPGDAVDVARALKAALTCSDEERRQRADAGRQRASEFTWERSLEQHRVAYAMAVGP